MSVAPIIVNWPIPARGIRCRLFGIFGSASKKSRMSIIAIIIAKPSERNVSEVSQHAEHVMCSAPVIPVVVTDQIRSPGEIAAGLTEPLVKAAVARHVAFLPGVSSASDIMRGLDLGLSRFKYFPAEASGGIRTLTALSAPFPQVRFCPTGGITLTNAPHWLALESVLCVGGYGSCLQAFPTL